jgi:hypothetical protein
MMPKVDESLSGELCSSGDFEAIILWLVESSSCVGVGRMVTGAWVHPASMQGFLVLQGSAEPVKSSIAASWHCNVQPRSVRLIPLLNSLFFVLM